MRMYEEKDYRGFTLRKKGKQNIQIAKGTKIIGGAPTEKSAMRVVDNHIELFGIEK